VSGQSSLSRAPRPSSLADVLDLILDKGLVIDAYVRVSVVGIEILTIDARIVIASVDTYLHFAEAVNRLDLRQDGSKGITSLLSGDDDDSDQDNGNGNGSRSRASRQPSRALRQGNGRSSKQQDDDDEPGLVRRLADRGRRGDD
jgi:hypothetical protein